MQNKHNVNHRKMKKALFFNTKKFRPDGKDGPEF